MEMYKIDFVQVRKLTVYCKADDEGGAEEWINKHKDHILDHLNLDHPQIEFPFDVHCHTIYNIEEDNSAQQFFDLLYGEQPETGKQMEAVYKVLKQEPEQESDNGTPN